MLTRKLKRKGLKKVYKQLVAGFGLPATITTLPRTLKKDTYFIMTTAFL